MKVHLTDKVPGEAGALCVVEIEFTSKARRVRVQATDGLEALDLRGERPGGLYDAATTLPRLHVPLRVTKSGARTARVSITVEDVAGAVAPESWEGTVTLEAAPKTIAGAAMLGAFAVVAALILWFVVLPMMRSPALPSLTGQQWTKADATLRNQGYASVVRFQEPLTPEQSDRVLEQFPSAGERPAKGSPVMLVVGRTGAGGASPSAGLVTVPSVVGLSRAQAESRLAGLMHNIVQKEAPAAQVDQVLEQNPKAGTRVAPGSAEVEIVIGVASALVAPRVVGLSRADAEAALKTAGVAVKVVEKDAPAESAGLVLAQYPDSGDKIAADGSMEITVGRTAAAPSTPAAAVDVPNVVGQQRADAEKAIADAGLTPTVVADVASDLPEGTVVDQEPATGKVPPRSTVTLRLPKPRADVSGPAPGPGTPPATPTESPPAMATESPPAMATEPPPAMAPEPPPAMATEPDSPPTTATDLGATGMGEPTSPAAAPSVPTAPVPSAPNPPPSPIPLTSPPASNPAPMPGTTATPAGTPAVAPDLIGLSRTAAEFELKKLGLTARVWEEAVADTPEGMVLRQTPPASEPVLGGAVELTVSKRPGPAAGTTHAPTDPSTPVAPTAPPDDTNPPQGTAPTPGPTATPEPGTTPAREARVAPNVIGRIEADAFVALRDASIAYQVDFEDVTPERAGRVLRQDPPPTTPIGKGIRVALTIGRARATPRPSVSTVPRATEGVPRASTTTVSPSGNSSLPPPGRHSRSGPATPFARSTSSTGTQSTPPPPPSPVARPVAMPPPPLSPSPLSPPPPTLAIRPTSETVSVPDLGGRDATEAVEVALRAGLVPTIVADRDARAQVGRVRLQMPAAGSTARVGSSVSFHVGGGTSANMVDVPDVIGLPSGDAAARLASSGFATQLIRSNAKPGLFANPDQVVGQMPVGRFSADAARVVRIFLP